MVSHGETSPPGLTSALRTVRDPLLLFAVPMSFAVGSIVFGWLPAWGIGFDFVGTLWEPARAVLEGGPIYPEPTRASIVVGNPAVYPPPAILATVPLALLPEAVAAWIWFCVLGAGVVASMWMVGVRDWRCHALAVTSPIVVHGLVFGNLTVAIVVALAVAWRYREKARVVGFALGAAIAAKFFVWPLVAWLLLTRRFRAAAWAVGSAALLVVGAWALVGFEGFADYPALLNAVQDVYAIRSVSLGTVAGGVGASVSLAVAVCWLAGLALIGVAGLVAHRGDGDRRVFAILVAASIVASPIVWPYYLALLLVPIAVTWPRLAPMWFFGYAISLVGMLTPRPRVDAQETCCRPAGVPEQAWAWSHTDPVPWFAGGVMGVVIAVTAVIVASRHRQLGAA